MVGGVGAPAVEGTSAAMAEISGSESIHMSGLSSYSGESGEESDSRPRRKKKKRGVNSRSFAEKR